ncbi:restriction endonuclease subunit S [Chitinophaga silvatica]|uniref:Restriction endonuclease subunit S n=1 Tax=Chitinophaga silvatica TaxID=2282649 RepID=A0A3E1Y5M1_9BACT|nr:restriction endonuclease subunit S [Chitinophaga silvatica]RFS20025.1 restriction endonuclease subunit S [Chitinophaga silvatica]
MTWETVRLKEVISHRKGFVEINDETEYKLVTVKLHRKGVVLRENLKGSQIRTKKQQVCRAGYFIVAEMDAKVGGYGFVPDHLDGAIVSSHYFLFELNENRLRPKYLEVISQLRILQDQIKAVGSTNYAAIRPYDVLDWEIPLPPIEKQQEIETLYLETRSKIDNLNIELSYQLNLIDQLNQAILQEAVQGKLVPQDDKDEPADDLLKRIKAQKDFLIKSKKLKIGKSTDQSVSYTDEYRIPESWIWCKVDDIFFVTKLAGFEYTKHIKLKEAGEIPVVRAQNVRPLYIDKTKLLYIDERTSFSLERCSLTKKCLLVTFIGAGIGDVATFNENRRWHLAPNVAKMEPFEGCDETIDVMFFNYFLLSNIGQRELFKHMKATAQPSLSMGTIRDIDIPLPPFSEQKRIVQEIEFRFAKTKQLKEYIIANQQATDQLLKAFLHQAFELKEKGEPVIKSNGKAIELTTSTISWNNLAAAPFEKRAAQPVNNIQNIDWEMALMVACMKNKLGVTYGDVGLQKNVFNTNYLQPIFSKQYNFINSNFGTYSSELKDDLKRNPYLISKKIANNKEVYIVNPKYSKQVLNKLSAPENRGFVKAIENMLSIYEQPFINKETDKIELYNTVLKVAIDKRTTDINVIYQEMKNWKINQPIYTTKAEKFSKSDSGKMLKLLIEKGIL